MWSSDGTQILTGIVLSGGDVSNGLATPVVLARVEEPASVKKLTLLQYTR